MIRKSSVAIFLLTVSLSVGAAGSRPAYAGNAAADSEMITQIESSSDADSTMEDQVKTKITGADIEDGSYPIEVSVTSGTLRVSEAVLTAENGTLTLHLTLKDGSTTDVETEALDQAISVKNSEIVPLSSSLPDGALKMSASKAYQPLQYKDIPLRSGVTWKVSVSMEGGSGRASVASPCEITVDEDGRATALIEWSSSHYDYMIVGGEKYTPVNSAESQPEAENSRFEIPVAALDEPETVIADTTAMSKPHEIEYTLTFSSEGVTEKNAPAHETTAAERIGGIVAVVLLAFLGAWGFRILMRRKIL